MKIEITLETEEDKRDADAVIEVLEQDAADFGLDKEGAPVLFGVIDALKEAKNK